MLPVAVDQSIVATSGHRLKSLRPTFSRLPDGTDYERVVTYADFHLSVEAGLFDEEFRNANSLRIPDLDYSRSHDRTSNVITL